jgi:large conductance mechanosensitive channel
MGIIKEFKEFIIKGNAIDMAVGIIIGAAFGAVVKSLVDNVMMPPLGYLMGGIDFASYAYEAAPALKAGDTHPVTQLAVEKDVPAVVIRYGLFINSLITLIIQGFAIFLVVKAINRLKRKQVTSPETVPLPADVQLLTEIRDLLKK